MFFCHLFKEWEREGVGNVFGGPLQVYLSDLRVILTFVINSKKTQLKEMFISLYIDGEMPPRPPPLEPIYAPVPDIQADLLKQLSDKIFKNIFAF